MPSRRSVLSVGGPHERVVSIWIDLSGLIVIAAARLVVWPAATGPSPLRWGVEERPSQKGSVGPNRSIVISGVPSDRAEPRMVGLKWRRCRSWVLCPSDYRVRLVPRNAGWFPRLGQGALPRSRKSTSTLWVLPVLCLSSYFRLARGHRALHDPVGMREGRGGRGWHSFLCPEGQSDCTSGLTRCGSGVGGINLFSRTENVAASEGSSRLSREPQSQRPSLPPVLTFVSPPSPFV